MASDSDGEAKKGFPFITGAVALVFVMVGGAVAWGVQKCGDTDFKISVRDGLQLTCKAPPPPPKPKPEPKPHPELGYVYYGRLKANGEPSDKGKLRPANNAPLPYPKDIRKGDIFIGTDIKQFRIGSSTSDATREMKAGTCYSTVKLDRFISDREADGVWLEAQTLDCP